MTNNPRNPVSVRLESAILGDMTDTRTALRVAKTYKIGRNDDEGIAAATTDLIECECCGRKIARVSILSNGLRVGSECADYLTRPDWRQTDREIAFYFGRRNKKAETYLAQNGYR